MFQHITEAKKFKIGCIKDDNRNSFTLSVLFFPQDNTAEPSQPLISFMGEVRICEWKPRCPQNIWGEISWELGRYGSQRPQRYVESTYCIMDSIRKPSHELLRMPHLQMFHLTRAPAALLTPPPNWPTNHDKFSMCASDGTEGKSLHMASEYMQEAAFLSGLGEIIKMST